MWSKAKTVARWLYDWATVIAASLVGVPSLLLQALSYLDGIDISPIVGPDTSLKIVTGVAVAKAVAAFIENIMTRGES